MQKLNKILVPLDFSDFSINALKFAVNLAHDFNARLYVLSVFHPHALTDAREMVHEDMDDFRENVEKQITHLKINLPQLAQLEWEFITEQGFAVDKTREKIRELGIDLLVMGTKGASGFKKIFFGSITAELVASAPCPVLAVPLSYSPGPIKNIAFAYDSRKTPDFTKLEILKDLVRFFGAQLHIVHVIDQDKSKSLREIDLFFKDIPHLYEFIHHDDVVDGLESYIAEHDVDLMILLRRKQGLLDMLLKTSITREMALSARVPILVIRETWVND